MPPRMSTIEFHGSEETMAKFPRPYPARTAVPDWYKALPLDLDGDEKKPTMKRCPPLLEAMAAGYILPAPCDFHFSMRPNGALDVEGLPEFLGAHKPGQYKGTPFEKSTVFKFMNPWIVRTPPGYSTLFVTPFNHFAMPFLLFSGVVETDTYYQRIHFPFLSLLAPGQDFKLKAGDPLVQAIPLRREDWDSRAVARDEAKHQADWEAIAANPHLYKQEHWKKREWT